MNPDGRPKTTGRHATRAELETAIRHDWQTTDLALSQIARDHGVSPPTARKIIEETSS